MTTLCVCVCVCVCVLCVCVCVEKGADEKGVSWWGKALDYLSTW